MQLLKFRACKNIHIIGGLQQCLNMTNTDIHGKDILIRIERAFPILNGKVCIIYTYMYVYSEYKFL